MNLGADFELLAYFDTEMRADPPAEPGLRYERAQNVVRARGAHNFIVWSKIEPDDTLAVVSAQAAEFRALGAPLEWKVYGHDSPTNLALALAAHGFAPDEPETLMIARCANVPLKPLPAGIDVRDVCDLSGLADFAKVTALAFDCDATWLLDELPQQLFGADPGGAAYVAYANDAPVACGRIRYPRGRAFASIWGGATVPDFRRRGIFAALVSLRVRAAQHAGYAFVTVDARETSRPLLERLGFAPLTSIVGWNLQLDDRDCNEKETRVPITDFERS